MQIISLPTSAPMLEEKKPYPVFHKIEVDEVPIMAVYKLK